MFKQARQHHNKTEEYYNSHNHHNPDDKDVRLPSLEHKMPSHSMEENRPNLNNRHKQDPAPSSNTKSQDKNTRGSGIRGIQVMSSRQSNSRERKGLATSRSHEKQKESRQIKSQTNISQFQSYIQGKQLSFEDRSHQKQMHQLCRHFQHKIRETILKNDAECQLQIDELTKVIQQNEDRIDNLIRSLNVLLEKNEKKQQVIEKLEDRLKSITNYHEQCYEYTLARCQNIQNIFRVIADQMDVQRVDKQMIQNKMKSVDLILKGIVSIQRIKSKQQMEFMEEEMLKMKRVVNNMDEQLYHLEEMNKGRQKFRQKEQELKQYIKHMKDTVAYRGDTPSQSQQPQINVRQPKLRQLQQLLESYKGRLDDLQSQKAQLTNIYLTKEEKAQQSIWQLSNLLNRHQRELQRKEKEVEQYLKYNIEIENKLIESKLKENSLRVQMQSFYKGLQTSKNDECDILFQEKECYKAKFQEIFKHNQYLQEVNSKNKLIMIRQQKQLSSFAQKLQQQQTQLYEYEKTKEEITKKEQQWQDLLKDQKRKLQKEILRLQQQNQQKQQIVNQNSKQILALQTELKESLEDKLTIQKQLTNLQSAYFKIKKELQQEELYSQHLQNQNQQLSNSLNQYKQIFQQQSSMFKSTIEKLKQENSLLQRNADSQPQKILENQAKRYERNRITFNPGLSKVCSFQKEPNIKLINLQKQLLNLGFKLPVLCQIDSLGYLKSCESGTYIYDVDQNPIQLTQEQKVLAIKLKILQLFQ